MSELPSLAGWAVEEARPTKRRRTPEPTEEVGGLGLKVPRPPPRGLAHLLSTPRDVHGSEEDELEHSDEDSGSDW